MTTILTHDSNFHSDDVFAVATLLLLFPDAKVIRSRKIEDRAGVDYMVDTGMEYDPTRHRFDHHQPGGAGQRENGIQYASFGLVWKEFGEKLAGGKREADLIDRQIVAPIDAHDNGMPIAEYKFPGIRDYTIGDFLSSFVESREPEHLTEVFMKVVLIAKDLLIREISTAKKVISNQDEVLSLYNASADKRLVVMNETLWGWREVLGQTPDALYVVHSRPDGGWTLACVPDLSKPYYGAIRKPLPLEWAGKTDAELQQITGVKDAIFAHRGRFMAAAKSKEGAIELAQKALNA
jgi:uncharacterized UPF0160 family protein